MECVMYIYQYETQPLDFDMPAQGLHWTTLDALILNRPRGHRQELPSLAPYVGHLRLVLVPATVAKKEHSIRLLLKCLRYKHRRVRVSVRVNPKCLGGAWCRAGGEHTAERIVVCSASGCHLPLKRRRPPYAIFVIIGGVDLLKLQDFNPIRGWSFFCRYDRRCRCRLLSGRLLYDFNPIRGWSFLCRYDRRCRCRLLSGRLLYDFNPITGWSFLCRYGRR